MAKLGKCELPSGHSFDDFKCFGPPATKDTEFSNTKLCDMGCFAQEEVCMFTTFGLLNDMARQVK